MKKFVVLAALAFCAAGLCAGQSARAEEAKKWTEIHIGTEGAFRPWNYTNPDGSLGGFEIDLYQDLCRRMQAKCTIAAQSFDSLIPSLTAGKFDAIIAGMSATPKREQVIAFSVPYGTTGQTFATLKTDSLANMPEKGEVFSLATDEAGAMKAIDALKPALKGKTIGVQSASIAAAFVNQYLKGVVDVREYKATEQHDLDLMAGRVDFIMASMAYLGTMAAKPGHEDVTLTGPRFQGGLLGAGSSVGLRKTDPELKVMFDKAIHEAQADGFIRTLSMKYFGFDVTPK